MEKLSGKTLVVTCGNSCYQLWSGVVQPISELESTQEEADTRMLLHSLHAARSRFTSVVIVSEDTDVLVLLLALKFLLLPQYSLNVVRRLESSTLKSPE